MYNQSRSWSFAKYMKGNVVESCASLCKNGFLNLNATSKELLPLRYKTSESNFYATVYVKAVLTATH